MTTRIQQTLKALYQEDFCLWVEMTLQQLQERQFEKVDWENLLEEVADLSQRERDKRVSLLTKLFEHLLKLGYWKTERDYNQAKWKAEIRTFRQQLKKLLKNSPSLKPYLIEVFGDCYTDARMVIIDLTKLPAQTLPIEPICTVEQVLDDHWLPII